MPAAKTHASIYCGWWSEQVPHQWAPRPAKQSSESLPLSPAQREIFHIFLIMQGRITKVLNMKPQETLSMLEEAAGTRMHEMKKEDCLKPLVKKQTKVDEIDNVLSQDILPALEKLRKEWSSGNAQLERLKRFCIAYQYTSADQVKSSALSEISDRKAKITEFQEEYMKIKAGVTEMDGTIAAITEEKEKQMSSDFKVLSETVDKLSKELVKVGLAVINQKDILEVEKAAVAMIAFIPQAISPIPHHQIIKGKCFKVLTRTGFLLVA